jgi:diguanylate cyclase (GGDEF)-like protein
MHDPIQLLFVGGGSAPPDLSTSSFGPFVVQACADLADAAEALRAGRYDALLLRAADDLQPLLHWPLLPAVAPETALVVLTPEPVAADVARLLQLGVQEVVPLRDAQPERIALALCQAVERKRIDAATRLSHATDLGTGLPNHAQLMEHMTHLLALREREPAPMALLVLRVEGLAAAQANLGAEGANVLRRKIAVRLRSGLRASDVVASLGADCFGVLLAWIDEAADAQRVATKLTESLQRPFGVAGQDIAVAVGAGVARYPGDGREADLLLRVASSAASQDNVQGHAGLVRRTQAGGSAAANDEVPTQF